MKKDRYYSFLVDTQFSDDPGVGRYIGSYTDNLTKLTFFVFQIHPGDHFGIFYEAIRYTPEYVEMKFVIEHNCPTSIYDYKYYSREEKEIHGLVSMLFSYKVNFPVFYE